MEIEKERTDNVCSNIIDENVYNTLNINLPENKNNNLNEFLIKFFPNEKVFENEYTSEKVFVLDKFIKTKIKNKKRISKSNYTKNLISKIKKDKISYETLLPMNKIWNEYINNLLNGTLNEEIIASKLLKADLHGSIIEVINSNNKNNIGIKGILLYESKSVLLYEIFLLLYEILSSNPIYKEFDDSVPNFTFNPSLRHRHTSSATNLPLHLCYPQCPFP